MNGININLCVTPAACDTIFNEPGNNVCSVSVTLGLSMRITGIKPVVATLLYDCFEMPSLEQAMVLAVKDLMSQFTGETSADNSTSLDKPVRKGVILKFPGKSQKSEEEKPVRRLQPGDKGFWEQPDEPPDAS
jgi:hypothetical protein